uniref:KxYKxGKxW signal peptide domain-containing protein n=1 Tax=Secundilactobacillus hailunensis TaxID=2559923 RepID=UPI0010F73D2D
MEKDYRKISKNNNLGEQEKDHLHYRMYKAKKSWLFAGIFMLGLLSVASPVKAATQPAITDNSSVATSATSASTKTADDVNTSAVVSKATSNSDNMSNVSQSGTISDSDVKTATARANQTTPTTNADTSTTQSNSNTTKASDGTSAKAVSDTSTTQSNSNTAKTNDGKSAKATSDTTKGVVTQPDSSAGSQQTQAAPTSGAKDNTTVQKAVSDAASTVTPTTDVPSESSNKQLTDGTTGQTTPNVDSKNTAGTQTAAATTEPASNVRVTNLNGVDKITLIDPTTEELNQARQSAASLYKSKGMTVEIDVVGASTNLPVGDPTNANYQAGYQAAANDLAKNNGSASIKKVGSFIGSTPGVGIDYSLLSNLYDLGKVYEAGRIANGVDVSKDIHYTVDGLGQNDTKTDVPTTKTDTPYNIDISNPNSWWIDPSNDGVKYTGILGLTKDDSLQKDTNFQAGYQAFIKQWAQGLDDFYTALGSSLKSYGDDYANAIAYQAGVDSGKTIPLKIWEPLQGGYNVLDHTLDKLTLASNNKLNVQSLYLASVTTAINQMKTQVTDTTAINAIQKNLEDVVHVWNFYIPMFQPLIQSYLEKAIMSDPVSLAGQNGFDAQFLNDGTTFADITFKIMNGFDYGGATIGLGGNVKFPREIFSEFVTQIYPAIRNVIEHVDYVAAIDGENDFFNDYLNKANAITNNNGTLTTSDSVKTSGLLSFDNNQDAKDSTKLSHDGFYTTADTAFGKIKEAAFEAAISGKGADASQFLLSASNTNGKTVVKDKNGNVYQDYSTYLDGTNAMVQSVYNAEYQAVKQAVADYKAGTKHNYTVTYTTYADGSYTTKLNQVAGNDGTFTWTNPASTDDTKGWYQKAVGTTTSYTDGQTGAQANKYATYDINVADYNNMYNYLASQKDATPATVVATVNYVVNPNMANEVSVGTGNAVGTDGKTLTVTLTPPAGFTLSDPSVTTWNVTLNSKGTNETKVGVSPIIYDVNNPGTLPGTSIDYLQGTVNETDVVKNSDGTVLSSNPGTPVKIKRTAQLDPTTKEVVYSNWETTDNSATIISKLSDAQLSTLAGANQAPVVSIQIKNGDYQANNQTYQGALVNTLNGNVDVTSTDLKNQRVTNPNVTSTGNDNEYLGQKPAETFNITRTVNVIDAKNLKGTITVNTNYTGDYTKNQNTSTPVNVTRTASVDANGQVTYGNWTVNGSTTLVNGISANDTGVAQPGFIVTVDGGDVYTSDMFNHYIATETPTDTGFSATVTRMVTYAAKTYSVTNPGDSTKGDPEGTEAKYLEGTISINRTNTGDYTAAVKPQPIAVTRTATVGKDGVVTYGNWETSAGNQVLVAALTPTSTGILQDGYTATIAAGSTDYTSDSFNIDIKGKTPTDTGYTGVVNQEVNYKAGSISYTVTFVNTSTNQQVTTINMTSPTGSTVNLLTDSRVLDALNTNPALAGEYMITPATNTTNPNRYVDALKVTNGNAYGVYVTKLAAPIVVTFIDTDGNSISNSKGQSNYVIKANTPGSELQIGQNYNLTPDQIIGYTYQKYSFNNVAGDSTQPSVTLTDGANNINLVYAKTTYTKDHPGVTGTDPEGSQAKYLNGVITVNYTASGTTADISSHNQTIHVFRTATINADGKTVSYTPWTTNTDGKVSVNEPVNLVDALTTANAPAVNGFTVAGVSGDTGAFTATDMAGITPSATDTATTKMLNRIVDYQAVEYTVDHPGTVEGTQQDYLQGTVTVNTSYTGLGTPKGPDTMHVAVQRTVHVNADGKTVTYSNWVSKSGSTTLVDAFTTADATPVTGYDVTGVSGDTGAYDSADFNAALAGDPTVTPAVPAEKAADGYKATLNRNVNYTKHSWGPTDGGGTNDPEGSQAKYLNGVITVNYTADGTTADISSHDETIHVYRTATINNDGTKVDYTPWTTNTDGKISVNEPANLVDELTTANAPTVNGFTVTGVSGDTSAFTATDMAGLTPGATDTATMKTLARTVNYTKDSTTTTTNDPDGGTTTTKVDGNGVVTQITKNWSDGDTSNIVIDETGSAAFTETPKDQPSLPNQTVTPGTTATSGKTTMANNEPDGIQLTHKFDDAPSVNETIDKNGNETISLVGNALSVDSKDYYNTITTTDPEGGTTTTRVDGSGAVTEVTKNWSDGDKTVAVVQTTPTTDPKTGETGTTSVVTVTETPKDQPSLPDVTVKPGESVKTGKTTVTNDNPGVTMTHDTPGTDTKGNPMTDQTGENVNPDGSSSFFKVAEPVSTTKDGYYNTITTTDPEGGTTTTKVDGSGAVT